MTQRIGRPAEKTFSLLCSEGGVTCNKSDEDDHGWDFVVDIPQDIPEGFPADYGGKVVQALVQVKSMPASSRSVRLKASNALHFAKSDQPCFLVAFTTDRKATSKVFARHFWKADIERSLKKAREEDAAGKKLNKSVLTFQFGPEEECSANLVLWLVNTVRSLPQDYASEKNRLGGSLGFEDGSLRGEITFGPMADIGELVDHQLGLTESIPISYLRLTDRRFGIEFPKPIFEGTPKRAQMRSNAVRSCEMILQATDGSTMSLAAKLTMPAIPNLPQEHIKMKLDCGHFVLAVKTSGIQDIALSVALSERVPLQHALEVSRLFAWSEVGKIEYRVVGDGFPLFHGSLRLSQGPSEPSFKGLARMLELLAEVARRAAFKVPMLSITDIMARWDRCVKFYGFLKNQQMQLSAEFTRPLPAGEELKIVTGYAELELDGFAAFVTMTYSVIEQTDLGEKVIWTLSPPIWRDCFVGLSIEKVRREGIVAHGRRFEKETEAALDLGDLAHPDAPP